MPWCDTCSLYHAHTDLRDGAACPDCGEVVSEANDSPQDPAHEEDEVRTVGQSAPWHFWIVVVALVIYIGWRIVVGIGWLINQI